MTKFINLKKKSVLKRNSIPIVLEMTNLEESPTLRCDDSEVDTRCYQNIDYGGAPKSSSKYLSLFAWCRFIRIFESMKSFSDNASSFISHAWMKHRTGEEIDRNFIITELARWIGRGRLTEEIAKHPRDFDEVVQIVFDFIASAEKEAGKEAEKEYYSGFYGFFRRVKERRKTKDGIIYKKIV